MNYNINFWSIRESLERRIGLKEYDKEAYSHTVNSAVFVGILIGMSLMVLIIK